MTRHVIEHDGLEREYFVFLPSDYEDSANFPVAFFFTAIVAPAPAPAPEPRLRPPTG